MRQASLRPAAGSGSTLGMQTTVGMLSALRSMCLASWPMRPFHALMVSGDSAQTLKRSLLVQAMFRPGRTTSAMTGT